MEYSPQQTISPANSNGLHRPLTVKIVASKILFILFILVGIRGLWEELRHIFLIYPKLSQDLSHSLYSQSLYLELLQKILVLSISNFLATTYGLVMLLRSSYLVKAFHFLVGSVILALVIYMNNNYQLPYNFETLMHIIKP